MSWFTDLSKAQQAEYIKNHPNSKYAKGNKPSAAKTPTRAAAKKAAAPIRPEGNGRMEYMNMAQSMAFETNPARKAQIKKQMAAHKKLYNLD